MELQKLRKSIFLLDTAIHVASMVNLPSIREAGGKNTSSSTLGRLPRSTPSHKWCFAKSEPCSAKEIAFLPRKICESMTVNHYLVQFHEAVSFTCVQPAQFARSWLSFDTESIHWKCWCSAIANIIKTWTQNQNVPGWSQPTKLLRGTHFWSKL